ncbi:MAG: LolA-like outer membrane lipoprotein chaperone [Campylobacterota bacterium]
MRRFLIALSASLSLFAAPKDLSSFNAKFIQTITDDNGKTIRYSGELWAAKPQNALWVYHKPIQKSVYVNGQKVTVIEPAIEQATLRTLDNEIDFLSIVQKAKPLGEGRYSATVKGQTYTVIFKNDILSSISYTDGFDNKIVITFNDQNQNRAIEPSRFKPLVPADYDILKG